MVCAAIFAAFVGYNVYSTQKSIQLDVTLNDVEAFGNPEIENYGQMKLQDINGCKICIRVSYSNYCNVHDQTPC